MDMGYDLETLVITGAVTTIGGIISLIGVSALDDGIIGRFYENHVHNHLVALWEYVTDLYRD